MLDTVSLLTQPAASRTGGPCAVSGATVAEKLVPRCTTESGRGSSASSTTVSPLAARVGLCGGALPPAVGSSSSVVISSRRACLPRKTLPSRRRRQQQLRGRAAVRPTRLSGRLRPGGPGGPPGRSLTPSSAVNGRPDRDGRCRLGPVRARRASRGRQIPFATSVITV